MGFFDDPANQPSGEDQIRTAAAAAGVPVGETDLRNYEGKNPEDRQQFITDLTQQFAQRATNAPNYGRTESEGGRGGGGFGGGRTNTAGSMSQYGTVAGLMPDDIMDRWTGTFVAPDASKLQDDPVVQARMRLGQNAMQASAAANGTLLTGGFQKGLNSFAQDVGSSEYANIYNRAQQEFLNSYNMFEGDRTRRAGVFSDTYRLGQGDTQLAQSQQGLNLNRDYFGLAANNQRFNQGETRTMNDFGMSNTTNQQYYDNLFRAGDQHLRAAGL